MRPVFFSSFKILFIWII